MSVPVKCVGVYMVFTLCMLHSDVLSSQLKGKALWAGMAKVEQMKMLFLGNQIADELIASKVESRDLCTLSLRGSCFLSS